MAKQSVVKTFKDGVVRKGDDGKFVFEEFTKDESNFYNITELFNNIVDVEGTVLTIKCNEDLLSDISEDEI